MYTLQYWHETRMEWRGCGVQSQDRAFVARSLLSHRNWTDGSVRFRIDYAPVFAS